MSLKYACFLSYRRIKSRAYNKIVEEIYEKLNEELSFILELEKPVYCPDRLWFEDDNSVEKRRDVAKALCESACMVLLYTPRYFNSKGCCLEYLTMEGLEEERVKFFKSPLGQKQRLIIPVILRGYKNYKNLRDDIKIDRKCFRLDRVSTTVIDRSMIISLAEHISELYEALQIEKQNFDCDNFGFPSLKDKEVKSRLEQLSQTGSSKPPFPGFPSQQ